MASAASDMIVEYMTWVMGTSWKDTGSEIWHCSLRMAKRDELLSIMTERQMDRSQRMNERDELLSIMTERQIDVSPAVDLRLAIIQKLVCRYIYIYADINKARV